MPLRAISWIVLSFFRSLSERCLPAPKTMKGHSRHRLLALVLVVAVCLVAFGRLQFAQPSPANESYDLVISNARIVDGSGNPWFRADVGIKDGRITRVGRIDPTRAQKTIDAKGQIVAPGFIDVHTHVESIYSLAAAENFVRMGVTTLVSGNCGSSATDVGQFLGRIKEKPLAVNLATLIGHGSVRRQAMGSDDRAPTEDETRKMEVDRKSTRLNSSHVVTSRMPSSA